MAKNPIDGIYLYRIAYKADGEERRKLISIGYSRSGYVRAFHGYGNNQIGSAGGYGYDKVDTALAEAVETLTGIELAVNGAAGFSAVQQACEERGITLINVLQNAISF